MTGSSHRPVEAVTFDIGSTLFPFRSQEMDRLLERFSVAVARRLGPHDRSALVTSYDRIRQEQYTRNLPDLRENDLVDRIRLTLEAVAPPAAVTPELLAVVVEDYVECLAETLTLPPGVPSVLVGLGENYRLGVITNYPYAPGTRRVLEVNQLGQYFRTVVISAEWGFVKPHPQLFRQAARGLGISLGAMVHVGDDWEADIIGAAHAGARSVYLTGLRDQPDPAAGRPPGAPIGVIERLEELPPLLERLQAGGSLAGH